MGLDVDYLAAKQAIEKLEKILSDQQHGKREKIADEIIEFVEKMRIKWGELIIYNHQKLQNLILNKILIYTSALKK